MTDPATSDTAAPVFRLVYRSHSRIPAGDRDAALAEILRVARSNNARASITGALLITDNWFVQALEGEQPAVQDLYERIARDGRHEQVTLIGTGAESAPVFSRWAMALISASGAADIPLEAAEGRVYPAAPDGERITRDQATVLRAMRNSIGADVL